jgi:hypothetical protein
MEGEWGAAWGGVFEVRERSLALWKLENLVRDYVAGRVDWDEVNRCAIQMECENTAEFLPGQEVLEELHSIFLTAEVKSPHSCLSWIPIEKRLNNKLQISLGPILM